MKGILVTGLLLGTLSTAGHAGDCSVGGGGTQLDGPATVAGSYVCAFAPLPSTDRWKELHQGTSAGGTLTEYAQGPGDPVDPEHLVGSWLPGPLDAKAIKYDYSGDGSYTFELWQNGSGTYFCEVGSTNLIATVSAITTNPAVDCP